MTEALGKDIWDFYVNGWPSSCSHDTGNREIAYWPSHFDMVGAICILQDDKEYDLKDFGTLWDCVTDNIITFEEAYLSWKGIEKPKPMTNVTATFPPTLISAALYNRIWCDAEEWPMVQEEMMSICEETDPDFDVEVWEFVDTEKFPTYSRCGNLIVPALGNGIYAKMTRNGSWIAQEIRKEGSYFSPTGDWWYLA